MELTHYKKNHIWNPPLHSEILYFNSVDQSNCFQSVVCGTLGFHEGAFGQRKPETESEAEGWKIQSAAFLPKINPFSLLTFFHVKAYLEKKFLLIFFKVTWNLKCVFSSTQKCNFKKITLQKKKIELIIKIYISRTLLSLLCNSSTLGTT